MFVFFFPTLWQTILWEGSGKTEKMGHGLNRKSKKHGYGISFPSKSFCRPLHLKGQFNCKPKQLYTSQCKPQTCNMQNMTVRRLVFIALWFGEYVFYCACTSLTQHACRECLSTGCVFAIMSSCFHLYHARE